MIIEDDQFKGSLLTFVKWTKTVIKYVAGNEAQAWIWQLIVRIAISDRKNMNLADWLLQIEKVKLLTNSIGHDLAMAKYTSTLYQMLKRMVGASSWHEIRENLEVYSPTATELHAASDLHRKQQLDETLQEYIQNFTDLKKPLE